MSQLVKHLTPTPKLINHCYSYGKRAPWGSNKLCNANDYTSPSNEWVSSGGTVRSLTNCTTYHTYLPTHLPNTLLGKQTELTTPLLLFQLLRNTTPPYAPAPPPIGGTRAHWVS